MKICVITPLFAFSGVPLAQIRFAKALADAGHEVQLLLGQISPVLEFPGLEGLQIINLGRPNVRSLLIPLVRYCRREKPEVIFSAEDHLNVIVLLALIISRSRAKFSGSSRVTPFDTYSNTPFTKRWVLKHLMRMVMFRADALTCVSRDMVEQYRKVFRSPPHVYAYNIVDNRHARSLMNESVDEPWLLQRDVPRFIAAGALAPWKGFSDLILAARELSQTRDFRLLILGDGPLRGELQSLIAEYGLESHVKLVGRVNNPLKYFKSADVFVLSSLVEGMPNVLVEAMMCGCTPVSTNCDTGPSELLQDGRFGYLVPVGNPVSLAKAMAEAARNPVSGELLQEAIRPFSEKAVLRRHFEILGLGECKDVRGIAA